MFRRAYPLFRYDRRYSRCNKFEEKSDCKLKKKTLPIMYLLNPSIKEGEIVRDYYNGKISFETLLSYKEKIIDLLKKSGGIQMETTIHYLT